MRDEEAPTLPPGHWSENFRDFLSKCLVKDPAKRADCNTLLTHPFLEKVRPDMHDVNGESRNYTDTRVTSNLTLLYMSSPLTASYPPLHLNLTHWPLYG